MTIDSEFRSYQYIRESLQDLGWDTRNPRRGGSVYTQGEFRRHDPLLTVALGNRTPENIVRISWRGGMCYWVIEAKADPNGLEVALDEARKYADSINRISEGSARFATGVSGTPDHSIYIETHYWNGSEWHRVSINNYHATGLLTVEQCRRILDRNNHEADYFDDDPDRFLRKAHAINKTLHSNEIPIGDRARLLASLLLALAHDPNLPLHETTTRMVREVNGCILDFLGLHGKRNFAPAVQLTEPVSESNHYKYRRAIVETLQHLREMNIRSAINSGDDSLGKFYETFLKYANGAKEMGIVLTPRHITKFAVDVVGVGPDDKVFDPACGTGGFLVSAMDGMRRLVDSEPYSAFKNDGLFGVEQRDDVYGLALVNMIFRGDGKSHIENGNCFDYEFWQRDGQVFHQTRSNGHPRLEGATRPFSRVLMNPPFKLEGTSETEFVDYALTQTQRSGVLFAILPHVAIEGKSYSTWRQELLKRHTLKAVVKFDKNLFYPVTESTYGVIVEAHIPHSADTKILMGVLFDDNHRPQRSKLLSEHEAVDNVSQMTELLRRFLSGRPLRDASKPREFVLSAINSETFAPEAYLPSGLPETVTSSSARRISLVTAKQLVEERRSQHERNDTEPVQLRAFPLLELVSEVIAPPLKTLKNLLEGPIPVISATSKDNGIAGWRDVPVGLCLRDCITISRIHNTKPCEAFWHPYDFSALSGKVHIVKPVADLVDNEAAVLYLCQAITSGNAWRYDYARQVKLEEIEIYLPAIGDVPDIDAMGRL